MAAARTNRDGVRASLTTAPLIGVVRTDSADEARQVAEALLNSDLELIEITFTVPGATDLVRSLLAQRNAGQSSSGPPWIGMGTVTGAARAEAALAAGAEFIVSPNTDPEVARAARQGDVLLVLGALTPTEIVAARDMGADLVKVYPLPPIGGPAYLATVRQPLSDITMLAAGGFAVSEIPAYRAAGAVAFGIGTPLLQDSPGNSGDSPDRALQRGVKKALALARGHSAGDTAEDSAEDADN